MVLELLNAQPSAVDNPEHTLGLEGITLISDAFAYGNTLTVTVNVAPLGTPAAVVGTTLYTACREVLVEFTKVPLMLD